MVTTVFHRTLGTGTVISIDGEYISVRFSSGIKEFSYPDCFNSYLKFEDPALQSEVDSKNLIQQAYQTKAREDLSNSFFSRVKSLRPTGAVSNSVTLKKFFKDRNLYDQFLYAQKILRKNKLGYLLQKKYLYESKDNYTAVFSILRTINCTEADDPVILEKFKNLV